MPSRSSPARHAQRHIGMAQRLATDPDARRRRDDTLRAVLGARSIGDVVEVAGRIVHVATEDAKALTAERDEAERASLLRTVGVAEGAAVPPAVRAQLSALEDDQKRRATRSLRRRHRSRPHRSAVDVPRRRAPPVRPHRGSHQPRAGVRACARSPTRGSRERTLTVLDQIAETRRNLEQNVAPVLALESMLVTVRERKDSVKKIARARPDRRRRPGRGILALSGCLYSAIPTDGPVSTASTAPDTSGVSAEASLPYYSQTLDWSSCGTGFECTTVTAPLDYSDTAAGDIELSVVRHRAKRRAGRRFAADQPGRAGGERSAVRPGEPVDRRGQQAGAPRSTSSASTRAASAPRPP